ncbi:hypothetical protein FACS1894208_00500 [Clostridia bacterium]|nr:hypothetical protein FACS1894208_00500 [Clostridia bacterium]
MNAATLLHAQGVKFYRLFIYLLVTPNIASAIYRVTRLKPLKSVTIYAQAERNDRLGIRPNADQLEFAQRYIYGGNYRRETWTDYCKKRGIE